MIIKSENMSEKENRGDIASPHVSNPRPREKMLQGDG